MRHLSPAALVLVLAIACLATTTHGAEPPSWQMAPVMNPAPYTPPPPTYPPTRPVPPTGLAENEGRAWLQLHDGSRLAGELLGIDVLDMETAMGRVSIPIKLVAAIHLVGEATSATVEFRNGDRLTGRLTLSPLRLKTAFGEVSVEPKHVLAVRCEVAIAAPTYPSAYHAPISAYAPGRTGTTPSRPPVRARYDGPTTVTPAAPAETSQPIAPEPAPPIASQSPTIR